MPERFVKEARTIAADAHDEARAGGSSTVEAEHVLLALARDDGGLAGEVLRSSGLDHAIIRQALDEEYERSLSAVGVSLDALSPRRRPPLAGRPRWAPSGKAALERALEAARARGDRRIGSGHILLGVLAAEQGNGPARAARRRRGAGGARGRDARRHEPLVRLTEGWKPRGAGREHALRRARALTLRRVEAHGHSPWGTRIPCADAADRLHPRGRAVV